jgi:hypothetical protein
MGLFKTLGKMFQGESLFDVPSDAPQRLDTAQTSSLINTPPTREEPPVTPGQEEAVRAIPIFTIEHCRSHIDGDNMDVTVWVTNTSDVDIEIDKCVILDTKIEIDRRLSPGQAHEIVLYRGPIAKNDLAHKANIFYKAIKANDYLRVDFSVEYNREADDRYVVEELHPEEYAVKDLSHGSLL